jgi:hypothetical protein
LVGNGGHVLGIECSKRVVRCVRRFFGGRKDLLEDVVQECYAKFADPLVLERFKPPPGRDRADAFRAWVHTVSLRTCIDRSDSVRRDEQLVRRAIERGGGPAPQVTPQQALAIACILEKGQSAVSSVRARWWSRGPETKRRFESLLEAVFADNVDYPALCAELGASAVALRRAKSDLVEDLCTAFRWLVEDELPLEPGLDRASVELAVDREIDDLFACAYPGESVRWLALGDELEEPGESDT